jgi:hypothetical protein
MVRPRVVPLPGPAGAVRLVEPGLLAIDLRDYGIDPAVWERLTEREPFFHAPTYSVVTDPGGTDQYGRPTAGRQRTVRKVGPGGWLDPAAVRDLYALTRSSCPVVLADWWFAQTSIEADRGGIGTGFGYYDFLGLKTRADYFKLIGFAESDPRSVVSEVGAVVLGVNSGVAQNNRMAVRRAAVDGFAWFTLDALDSNRDERDPLTFLDRQKGLVHDAERHFGRLPNGLPVVIACNAKGELQESAPDRIGPDKTAGGNDQRIHAAKSCFSCHSNGGLKDLPDEVRAIFQADRQRGQYLLNSPLKDEQLKLARIYLRDIQQKIDDDRRDYERAVKEACGLTFREFGGAYREQYERYVLGSVGPDEAARYVGCTPAEFSQRVGAYRTADRLLAVPLASLAKGRQIPRTNFELIYPVLSEVVRGRKLEVLKP